MTRAVGAVLVALGVGLVVRSVFLLSGRGRPVRGPCPAFVIAGPYRRVRNPLCGGGVIALGGGALAAGSVAFALATVVAAALAHAWIVLVEEPRLTDRFGDAYRAYLRSVPRWLPHAMRAGDDFVP